jgi:hypothetical protein
LDTHQCVFCLIFCQDLLTIDLSKLSPEDSRSEVESQLEEAITESLLSALDIIRIVVRKQSKSIISQVSDDFQALYEKKGHLPSVVGAMSCFLSASGVTYPMCVCELR